MDIALAKMLNSTVGTLDYRALDKMLYSRQGLVPSENAYFNIENITNQRATVLTNTTSMSVESTTPIVRIKMWADGGFSIGAKIIYGIDSSVSSGAWEVNITGGLSVYVNGTFVKRGTVSKSGALNGTYTGEPRVDGVYFSAGDVVEIKTYISANTKYTSTKIQFLCEMDSSEPIVIYANSVEKPFDILGAE